MTAPDRPFVHALALCESDDVGPGTRVWAFAHVLPGAVVGRDCNIGDHAYLEGGSRIGDRVTVKNNALVWAGVEVEDDVFLGPNVVFTNDLNPRAAIHKAPEDLSRTLVRRGATLGANVTVVCDTTIGEGAFVAAGTVVVGDVPAYALLLGNPGRRVGWMCACGQRLPDELRCACGRRYELVDERTGLVPADASSASVGSAASFAESDPPSSSSGIGHGIASSGSSGCTDVPGMSGRHS